MKIKLAPVALFLLFHASAFLSPDPPAVTRIDPDGVAHVQYAFSGPRRKLFACLGTARASLKVEFTIDRQLPIREPQN